MKSSSLRQACLIAVGSAALVAACGPTTSNPSHNGDGGDPDAGPAGCQGPQCFNYCPSGTSTTISGRVTAPNGIDPVPGALVYVPYTVEEFPSDVQCEICDQITSAAQVI